MQDLLSKESVKRVSQKLKGFDEKLKVCVPTGVTRYYPYFGGKNGNGQNNQEPSDNNNTNGNGSNGNGANGNGANGNGNGGE